QRLRKDDVVERAGLELRQAPLEIALDHVDAVGDAGEHVGVVDLDAVSGDVARALQVLEQHAVAAAEIEHARPRPDPAGDRVEVGALEAVAAVLHGARSLAMRSKYSATSR